MGTFQTKERAAKCDDCTESSYCDETGLDHSKTCPLGAYCPTGTITPKNCPRGTFNPESAAINVTDCDPCTPGDYCGETKMNKTSGKCYAGYYCTLGSPDPNPVSIYG